MPEEPKKLSRARFRVVPIGSHTGWGLEVDGVIVSSDPNMLRLAAWVDAVMAVASEYDAGFIAKAIAKRPWPTHDEVMAVYGATGGPQPSREPFKDKDHPGG